MNGGGTLSGQDTPTRRLTAIGYRDPDSRTAACAGSCATEAFAACGDGRVLLPIFARARTDVPTACACCGAMLAVVPAADAVARNIEPWLRYEAISGADVGAREAYARMAAIAMEGALNHEWFSFYDAQPEVQSAWAAGEAGDERWSEIHDIVRERAERQRFFVLADGTWKLAGWDNAPPSRDIVTHAPLILFDDAHDDGSEGIWDAFGKEFDAAYRGAALIRAGTRVVVPNQTSIEFVPYEPGSSQVRMQLVRYDEPPASAFLAVQKQPPKYAPVIALDARRDSPIELTL